MYTTVNGIAMHFEVHGPTHGQPLLLIHGFPLSGKLWQPVIPLLQDQFKLIVPDLRGFGRSELSHHVEPGMSVSTSIVQYADDLFSLLEAIGETRPMVVVGLSMGGYIALEFYRRYTSQVQGLVLADTRAQADSAEQRRQRYATAQRVLDEGSHVVANAMVDKLFAPQTSSELREQWRELMRETSRESVASALLAMAVRSDCRLLLEKIYCPTLIIVGERDVITPIADAQLMHRAILASDLSIIPEAGHMTPVEQPVLFAAALQRFVKPQAGEISSSR